MARSLYSEANTCFILCMTSSRPSTFRKLSCWPANEASGRSSAVADERTANDAPGLPALSRANSLASASRTSPRSRRAVVFLGGEAAEPGIEALGRRAVLEEFAERMGRGGKARRHTHALRDLRDLHAQACVFPAHGLDIGHSQVFKRYDQGGRAEKCRHGKTPEVETGSARRPLAHRGRAAMHGLRLCRCAGVTQCMVRMRGCMARMRGRDNSCRL